ncbi:MAG TPA: hypothetical protein VFQ77_06965 [Pseudonocardiaceae bacterium]|nr:hypothetical protein [Pseudonocardiaceae bacterium]
MFADYLRLALRPSALMGLPGVDIFTHDARWPSARTGRRPARRAHPGAAVDPPD